MARFSHPGPWRYPCVPRASLIGHNDIAPYNVCFDGDRLAGVSDWDLAGDAGLRRLMSQGGPERSRQRSTN